MFESGRTLGAGLKASLAKSLLDYFNDPTVPTSGDELTFFMTKEIMNRLSPSLLVVNFWDIDIAHYGAYSLYLEAIRRTDRLVHELWQHAQSLPQYRDRTTLLVVPELGRDSDVAGTGSRTTAAATSPAGACGSWPPGWRPQGRRERTAPSGQPTSRRPWRGFSDSRCRNAKAGLSRNWLSSGSPCSSTPA